MHELFLKLGLEASPGEIDCSRDRNAIRSLYYDIPAQFFSEEMRMYDQLGRPEIDSISKAQLRSFFCLALSSYSFSSARCMHFWKVSVSPANLS